MTRACQVVLTAVTLLAGAARADIYEWRDASGARHFTNDKQGVPAEYQTAATVLVTEWQPTGTTAPALAAGAPPIEPPAPPAPPATEVGASDAVAWGEAYAAGMLAAMELGGGGGVQINGPLAVASVRSSERDDAPGAFYPPWPWYYPFVTTSFDRGRSRHLTLRMLLQDQFQIDRDGPYAYQRWDKPGLGPALAPFLPRGLPYGVGQFGRVIYR
jgi:hypothetical protein